MFSSITSLYSFLWGMSSRAHSSWVKTTATSSNVTDSSGCMVSDSVSRCLSLLLLLHRPEGGRVEHKADRAARWSEPGEALALMFVVDGALGD